MPTAHTASELGAAIRARRRAQGWTQVELASRSSVGRQWLVAVEHGHHRAEIGRLLRVLDTLGLELGLGPATKGGDATGRTWLTARDAAEAIRDEIERGDTDFALRHLARALDDFRRRTEPADLASFLSEPPSTGDHRWDTLLAASVGRQCRLRGVPAPAWTHAPALEQWWFPVADRMLMARTMQRTPVDFAARGIWLDCRALEVA